MRKLLFIFLSSLTYFSAFSQLHIHTSPCTRIVNDLAYSPCEEGNIKEIDFNLNSILLAKRVYPLQGNGITICLKENSPDFKDVDLHDHLLASSLTSPTVSDHANMMATIVTGSGITSPRNEGIAIKSKIISVDFKNLLPETKEFYLSNQVSVINHSYGTTIENFYGNNALAYDQSVENLPYLLHVFSSGNLGYALGTNKYDGLSGVATLTGNFKQAKNILTIGAINEYGQPLPSSSSGPAYDGRLKPELCAFSDEGTSGAAALVSGVAALMQELLMKKNNTKPDAALLKSILINSSDDVGPVGIDWRTGYGSLNAFQAIQTIDQNHYVRGVLSTGEDFNISVTAPSQAQNLKITLAWTDPSSSINGTTALVNDLDLEVIGSKKWLPWILNSYPQIDSLQKKAIRGKDALNNVEQVTIEDPADGSYAIHITANKVKEGQQTFYIAYHWDLADTLYWIAPVKDATVISGNNFLIRWKSTLKIEKGDLELSVDYGQTWSTIQKDILLSAGNFEWVCPAIFSTARLRMVVNGATFSTEDFSISPITTMSMLYQCADSLRLTWHTEDTNENNLTYHLYQYKKTDQRWIDLGQPSGHSITIHNANGNDIFAVKPVTALQVEGIRSDALIPEAQGVYCFYKNVTATLVNDSIQVACELSTTEYVTSIIFQKKILNDIISLDTLTVSPTNTYYSTSDGMLLEGNNTYRVQINLSNGKTVYSDFVSAEVFNKKNFFVFPNPIDQNKILTIHAKQFEEYTIQLYDAIGQQVYQNKFYEKKFELPMAFLTSGIYVYRIFNGNHQFHETGRIVLK